MGDRQGEESPKAIIFTGIQASGKSTFFKQHFRSGFVHINPTADDRQRYIKAAREHGYRIEGYFFQSIVRDCVERNSHRSGKACIPGKAIACTSNRLELPSYEEGFDALYFVRIQDGAFAVDRWNEVSDTM